MPHCLKTPLALSHKVSATYSAIRSARARTEPCPRTCCVAGRSEVAPTAGTATLAVGAKGHAWDAGHLARTKRWRDFSRAQRAAIIGGSTVERGVTGLVSTAKATARAPSTDLAGPNHQGRRSPRAATYSRVCGDSHKDSAGGEVDRRPRAVPDHHQHADPTTTHLRRRRCSRPTDARHRCRGDSTQVTSTVHLQSTGDACDRPEVVALKVGVRVPSVTPSEQGFCRRRWPRQRDVAHLCRQSARPHAKPRHTALRLAAPITPIRCGTGQRRRRVERSTSRPSCVVLRGGGCWNRSRRRSAGAPARSLDHLDAVVVAQVPKGPLGVLAGCAPLHHRSVAVVMERPERPNWCGSGLTIGSALARYRAVRNR
jgi:hypothetical protein